MDSLGGSRLLGQTSPLVLQKRKLHDGAFLITFLAFATVSIGAGVIGVQRNQYQALITGPPTTLGCKSVESPHVRRGLMAVIHRRGLADPQPLNPSQDLDVIAKHSWYLLPASVVLILVGVCMIMTLRHCARPFVYASMLMIPLSMASAAATLYATGEIYGSFLALALAAVFCLLLWCSRVGLRLCAALLEQAATVLMLHPGLMFVALALMLLTVAIAALAVAAEILLFSNGKWVGRAGSSCAWVVDANAEYGMAIVGFAFLWGGFLAFTLRSFIVSCVTAIWYFGQSGSALHANPDASSDSAARRAPVRTATKLAFTCSLGTLCFSSLVLTACQIVKALAKQVERRTDNLFVCLVACCLRCILNAVEFLNKFVVCMHAISGESFCSAGKGVASLFSRHALNAWFCDRISSYVLSTAAMSFAALGGCMTYFIVNDTDDRPGYPADKTVVAGAFGTAVFLLGWFVLSFCSSIILNIVDAAYTCLAVDMEFGCPHQPQMRDAMLPIVKPDYVVVVQHPGGHGPQAVAVAVGAPVQASSTIGPA